MSFAGLATIDWNVSSEIENSQFIFLVISNSSKAILSFIMVPNSSKILG